MYIRVGTKLLALVFFWLISASVALAANGTANGTILGPQGEKSVKTSYAFKNLTTGETISGNTGASGEFSQSLASTANFSFTAAFDKSISGFEHASNITLPYIRVPDGGTVGLGEIRAQYTVPETDKDLEEGALPSQCTVAPVAGAPVISRVDYVNPQYGAFMYSGRNIGVKIFTDKTGYIVGADFSIPENTQPGTKFVTAIDNGDGSYTANYTLVNTGLGGGLVTVTATNSGGLSSTACSESGPVNLDIKTVKPPNVADGTGSLFTGSDTTIFRDVADFRAMENFTMHIDGIVKVVFKKKINMLDKTTQSFMKNLAKKIAKGKGTFTLDAKAAIQLKNDSNAEITMYNVPYLDKPDIYVDDKIVTEADAKNIVFDKDKKTLTFLASHFSEYKAVPKISEVSIPVDNSTVGSESLTVTGKVNDAAATVRVKVNGAYVPVATVASDGTFTRAITLKAGKNTIVVEATNSIGSAVSISRTVTYQLAPTLTITGPDDQTTTSDSSITVKGSVTEMPVTVKIKVGDKEAVEATVASDGTFSQAIELASGKNAIVVTASNQAGSATINREVIRQALPATGTLPLWPVLFAFIMLGGVGLYFHGRHHVKG